MSYSKFLKAQGKSGKPPTIKKTEMSMAEKKRAQKGLCIKCGMNTPEKNSSACMACQSEDTLEDIQRDIKALRRRLLKAQSS